MEIFCMKKILLVIMLMLLVGCSGKNDNVLIMVTEAGFAPYEYYEDGEIVGVDVDIANEIAKALDKRLVIKDIAFDSIINEVKTGKADFGAAGISYTSDRAKNVDFSINYSTSKQIVIVNNNSNVRINGLDGKKIAVQLGSIADTYVTKNFKNSEVVRQKKYLAAIEDLKSLKVDAVVMDELPARKIVSKNDGIKILDGALMEESYGIIVKKGNKELLDKINEVLQRLSSEGKISEYVIKHMDK